MRKLPIKKAENSIKTPNVFLCDKNNKVLAEAFYDKDATTLEKITLLPGSLITSNHGTDGWMTDNLIELENSGCIQKDGNSYKVLTPLNGSPSGTAAAVLGKNGPTRPNGNKLWHYSNGKTLK